MQQLFTICSATMLPNKLNRNVARITVPISYVPHTRDNSNKEKYLLLNRLRANNTQTELAGKKELAN